MDQHRRWRRGCANIRCPLGLSANDEMILWGLLALALREPDTDGDFHATPHFCLSSLGLIDAQCRRGGQQYRQFGEAVERLSLVRYRNDFFYDPIRREHRKVCFGFFSYSLPLDLKSCRAWRFAWDPIFFELAKAASGHLRFDFTFYRQLDPASRRLFLVLSKIFHRRDTTPAFELHNLGVDVLGFSPTIIARDLKRKVTKAIWRLRDLGVVAECSGDALFVKKRPGVYTVRLKRGQYFTNVVMMKDPSTQELAASEPLHRIGFGDEEIPRIIRKYPSRLLHEWIDVTLAAMERKGPGFFRKSPQAFLIDNLKNALGGSRTPPEWWLEMRKTEADSPGRNRAGRSTTKGLEPTQGILQRMMNDNVLPSLAGLGTFPPRSSGD